MFKKGNCGIKYNYTVYVYCTIIKYAYTLACTIEMRVCFLCMCTCRFSSLFHEDKLGHCFDKDDPQLTLTTIQLLYQLVRSPAIAELICLHSSVACLPLTCYQCLLDPTLNTGDEDIIFKIRLQVQVHVYAHVVFHLERIHPVILHLRPLRYPHRNLPPLPPSPSSTRNY